MKKITILFVFLICLVGFSQTNNSRNVPISYLGDNNPTYAQSEPRVSSNLEITASGVGDCDIGNVDPTGFGVGNFGSNYLIGVAFTLEEEGTINSINLIGNDNGSLVQMAVYNDLTGVPNDLIVFSEIAEVVNGMNVYPVTPTVIPPGDYWIMAVFEVSGNNSNVFIGGGKTVFYTDLPFGDPIPLNAQDFLSYENQDFLFSLDITCEVLGNNDNTIEGFSFYPNPVTDAINLSSIENIERVTIYNILGQKVIDQDINATSSQLNVSSLVTGAYLIQVSVDSRTATYKVLKN